MVLEEIASLELDLEKSQTFGLWDNQRHCDKMESLSQGFSYILPK